MVNVLPDIIINKQLIEMKMKEKGINSMNQLAGDIGISPATLSRIMNGTRNPGQKVIGKMLTYFDVKFEELFSYNLLLTKVNEVN